MSFSRFPLRSIPCSSSRRPRSPWSLKQIRGSGTLYLPSAGPINHDDLIASTLPEQIEPSRPQYHPLEGISIAYHLRRRIVAGDNAKPRKYARVIGIRDPETGYLYLDEPGTENEPLNHARMLFSAVSVAERGRMSKEAMAACVEQATISVSSKEYIEEDDKRIRKQLKEHLLNCTTTKDIFRVAAAAFQSRANAARLFHMGQHLVRAFHRSRTSTSDHTIAARIFVLLKRCDKFGLKMDDIIIVNGLKFAVRSRSLSMTRRYLREMRLRQIPLGLHSFRAVIAKCSFGRQGFGEIRNGRWKRHELMQVFFGFDNVMPDEPGCHLETFLNRNDWGSVAAWAQVLSRIGAQDELWKEWLIWKDGDMRLENKAVNHEATSGTTVYPAFARDRGDRWFIHAFIDGGRIDWAWQVLKETGLDPFLLRRECLHTLLERVDCATIWNERLRLALLEKLSEDLAAIEQMLGVEWVTKNGFSFHTPRDNANAALEALSEPEFFEKYGFYQEDTE